MKQVIFGILVLGWAAAWPLGANARQFNAAQADTNGVKLELASVDPRATPDFLPSTSTPPFSHLCSCEDKGLAPMQCHMVISASGMDIMGQEKSNLKQCNAQPENELG